MAAFPVTPLLQCGLSIGLSEPCFCNLSCLTFIPFADLKRLAQLSIQDLLRQCVYCSDAGQLANLRKLDFVLGLTTAKIMERRLQTKAAKFSDTDVLALGRDVPVT